MHIRASSFTYFTGRMVLVAVSVYAVTAAVLFFNKTSYIYFPDNSEFQGCAYFSEDEKISWAGTRFYYRQHEGDDLVVLYHGNAGSACDRTFYASYFDAHDISYILVEYAGYAGDGARKPSRERILRDVEHVINFTKRLNYATLTILGESVGSGPAAYHTTLQHPDKLVLVSPFTTLTDVARIHYPYYPVSLLGKENYDNTKPLAQYKGEMLLIHGGADSIIPPSMSEALYRAAARASRKELALIPDTEHNDLLLQSGVLEKIITFIRN